MTVKQLKKQLEKVTNEDAEVTIWNDGDRYFLIDDIDLTWENEKNHEMVEFNVDMEK